MHGTECSRGVCLCAGACDRSVSRSVKLGRRSRAAIPEPEREGCQSSPPANGEEALAVIPSPSRFGMAVAPRHGDYSLTLRPGYESSPAALCPLSRSARSPVRAHLDRGRQRPAAWESFRTRPAVRPRARGRASRGRARGLTFSDAVRGTPACPRLFSSSESAPPVSGYRAAGCRPGLAPGRYSVVLE